MNIDFTAIPYRGYWLCPRRSDCWDNRWIVKNNQEDSYNVHHGSFDSKEAAMKAVDSWRD